MGISAFLCAAFACFCTVPAGYALEPLELHMENTFTGDGVLKIYCSANTDAIPQKSDFTATLGNTTLPIKAVDTFEHAGAGASYIFLVDVSGSIRQSQFQAIKDTLALICGGLSERDNISIFSVGYETYTQPFVSAPEDIKEQIDAIERSYEDTNLYDSVFKSLSILNTHENCREKKVLVIFSDGEDYGLAGITVDEAALKIKDSRIPIYTVAMLGEDPASQYVETAKVLGSFARLSAGGRHYVHTLDETASETIAEDISSSIRHSLIVGADLTGLRADGNSMDLTLTLTVAGHGTATDGYAISTAGLSAPEQDQPPPEESSPAPSQPPESQPAELQAPESQPPESTDSPSEKRSFLSGIPLWIIISGGAAVLILGGLAVCLILLRKKPETVLPPFPEPSFPEPEITPTAAIPQPTAAIPQPPLPRPSKPVPPPGMPEIALRLTKVGLVEEQVFLAEFAGTITVGRDPTRASLPFPSDELLSGLHCSLSYEPAGIVLNDLGSTNGTFVNGVPVQQGHVLENDDVLLIGSMELRINWEKLRKHG